MDIIQDKFKELKKYEINYNEFCECLNEENTDPFCKGLYDLFEFNDTQNKIDWRNFLIAFVNILTDNKNLKIKYAWNLLDINNNNYITINELYKILQSTHLSSKNEISKKIESIMRQIDKNKNDIISFNEFNDVINKFPNLIFPIIKL